MLRPEVHDRRNRFGANVLVRGIALTIAALALAMVLALLAQGAAHATGEETFPVASAICTDGFTTLDDPNPPGDCTNNATPSLLNDEGSGNDDRVNIERDSLASGTPAGASGDNLAVTFDLSALSGATTIVATIHVWAVPSGDPVSIQVGGPGGPAAFKYGFLPPAEFQTYSNDPLRVDVQTAAGGMFTVHVSTTCFPFTAKGDCGALVDKVDLVVETSEGGGTSTLTVDNNNEFCDDTTGDPYCTINAAIGDAMDGDTIDVLSGSYPGWETEKELTFNGNNASTITSGVTLN